MCVLYCQSAVKVYDGVLPSPRLCPDHASSHNNLGTLLEGEEAEFHLRMAVLHNPQHSRAYYNLGNLLGWVRGVHVMCIFYVLLLLLSPPSLPLPPFFLQLNLFSTHFLFPCCLVQKARQT